MADPLVDIVEFRVIGERKDDQGHLLVIGDDGFWYDYDIARGTVEPSEPSDSWSMDIMDHAPPQPDAPAPNVAGHPPTRFPTL